MKVTNDAFLDGRVMVAQPRDGFRSGTDAVLLAASVRAQSGQSVLELGIGAGAASLCLAARVPGLEMAGLEVQPDYCELARKNSAANGVAVSVHEGDVTAMPPGLSATSFDHVFMNPPYYRAGAWSAAKAGDRARALGESATLDAWIDAATRRLKPGGWLCVIAKATRLADLIHTTDDRLGSLEIKPIAPRNGRAAELVITRFRKGGRADPVLFAPLILHLGQTHKQDAAHFTPLAEAIFRDGGNLEF